MRISIKKGLNIPMSGQPSGEVQPLPPVKQVSLNLETFPEIRFKVLVKVGDIVKIGQPLVESKTTVPVTFVSPAAGAIKEIRRGLKRRLVGLVIEVNSKEEYFEHGSVDVATGTREAILQHLIKGGAFPHIRMRPFDLLANPEILPRDIFVRALESAPYATPAEMQVAGQERAFQVGLQALAKLTKGKIHLVHQAGTSCTAFTQAKGVEIHQASGPHPISNHSVHIARIAPINGPEDFVWTLSTLDVIVVGSLCEKGRYPIDRIVSIAGDGIVSEKRGYFKTRAGVPVSTLIASRIQNELLRFISGDPLMGIGVEQGDFLGFYDTGFAAIPENVERQMLHFFRPGFGKYSATRAYITGHLHPPPEGYAFTTSQHGEERPFIDSSVYEKVMPLRVPTMHLVKALIGEDFEQAELLGLLEVAPEDFALPTFICPSKVGMVDIVRDGLRRYAKEMGH